MEYNQTNIKFSKKAQAVIEGVTDHEQGQSQKWGGHYNRYTLTFIDGTTYESNSKSDILDYVRCMNEYDYQAILEPEFSHFEETDEQEEGYREEVISYRLMYGDTFIAEYQTAGQAMGLKASCEGKLYFENLKIVKCTYSNMTHLKACLSWLEWSLQAWQEPKGAMQEPDSRDGEPLTYEYVKGMYRDNKDGSESFPDYCDFLLDTEFITPQEATAFKAIYHKEAGTRG